MLKWFWYIQEAPDGKEYGSGGFDTEDDAEAAGVSWFTSKGWETIPFEVLNHQA